MSHNDPEMKSLGNAGASSSSVLVAFERGMDPHTAAAGAVNDLLELVDDEAQFAYYGSALRMVFLGFGERPPEAVLEVRQFLSAVHAQWPWWVHFLAPVPSQWRTLLFGLAPFRASQEGPTTDLRQLRRCVLSMLQANRTLYSHFERRPNASRVAALTTWTAIKRGLPG